MGRKRRHRRRFRGARLIRRLAVAALVAALAGCGGQHQPHYRTGNRHYDQRLQELAGLLEQEQGGPEQRFMVVQEISKVLRAAGAPRRRILFLTSYVEAHPTDPYNSFYLMSVAEGYRELGSAPLVAHYYERILRNYPDALVRGLSIHRSALDQLIALERDPHRLVVLYQELISRFSDAIDLGRSHFFLARAYEALGEWEQAVQADSVFLQYPETVIPGFPNAYADVQNKVNFHYSDKSWVVEDLDTLVSAVKQAIRRRDGRALRRLRAGSGFFAMTWEQQVADENVARVFDLAAFPLSRVQFDSELDPDSNAGEAFLRTTGWSYRVKTWYLYFRKIDFKADPEIDGRWEWAGIFFGEKL